jgi:phospholipid/cholesterol/gamma-HCH transport system permease protein
MNSTVDLNQPKLNFRLIHNTYYLAGNLTLSEINVHGKTLLTQLDEYPRKTLDIDLSDLKRLDSAGVAFLNHLKKSMQGMQITLQFVKVNPDIEKILTSFSIPERKPEVKKSKINLIEIIGEVAYNFFSVTFLNYAYLMADILYWSVIDLFKKKTHRKGEFINQAVLIGVNAVPIIALISFLIGSVLALQSAAQLRQFGANIFIADLIVIAMTREMGPLLTAVMIAGRSGSAIASEISTMSVTEEIDALKTMALNPIRYIVVPKIHASLITFPFLTILADILGILGGMVIAYLYLDLSLMVFYNRMVDALYFKDIITGIVKTIVFALIIVQTAAYFGFNVRGGAEGVGRYTTYAVVTSIFLVILADSILGLLFY